MSREGLDPGKGNTRKYVLFCNSAYLTGQVAGWSTCVWKCMAVDRFLYIFERELFFFFFVSLHQRLAPIGVCSLVAARVGGMKDILGTMQKLVFYMLTVICGQLIHSLVVLPLVFFIFTRKNPYVFMRGLTDALMTAFGIASRCVRRTFVAVFVYRNVERRFLS